MAGGGRNRRIALTTFVSLGVDSYPGDESYPLDERIEVVPAARLPALAARLRSRDEAATETGG